MYPDTLGLFAQTCISASVLVPCYCILRLYYMLFEQVSFCRASHHLKHTDHSSYVPSDPYLHTVPSPASVSSLIFALLTHYPSMPPISPNVPKITIAQAASPVHVVSSDHKQTSTLPSTDSIHIPSINSRRIWKPACCVMTLLLRNSSTR